MRHRHQRRLRKAIRHSGHRVPAFQRWVHHRRPAQLLTSLIADRAVPVRQRGEAARLLWTHRGDVDVYRPLLDHFLECDDPVDSWELANALSVRACSPTAEDERKLATLLREHPHEERRAATAQLLGHLNSPSVPAVLLETLEKRSETTYVRGRAAEALKWLGQPTPEVLAALIRTLQDPAPGARFWAAFALGGLVQFRRNLHPLAIDALLPLVDDPGDANENYWSVGREAQAMLEYMMPERAEAGRRERAAILADPQAPAELRRWAECYTW